MGYSYRTRNFSSSPGWEQDNSGTRIFIQSAWGRVHSSAWSEWKRIGSSGTLWAWILWLKLSHYAEMETSSPRTDTLPSYIKKGEARQTEIQVISSFPADSLTWPATHSLWLLRQIILIPFSRPSNLVNHLHFNSRNQFSGRNLPA